MSERVDIPKALAEFAGGALQWQDMVRHLAGRTQSELGRARLLALAPSADLAWIEREQQRHAEMQRLIAGGLFEFRGVLDVTELLERARIEGSALEPLELLAVLRHAQRIEAWRAAVFPESGARDAASEWPSIAEMSAPLARQNLSGLLRALNGKIEPDGGVSDEASPALARIRRQMGQQHKAIESSLRRALAKLTDDGAAQNAVITVRGERFVIPVKAEYKRRVGGVVHGSSSTGQTVFIEPMETIEHNNELTRLLDEEQAEVHRILVEMTKAVAREAEALAAGSAVLAAADAHQAVAKFALEYACVRPRFSASASADAAAAKEVAERVAAGGALDLSEAPFALVDARHPLLEMRLREEEATIMPLTIGLPQGQRQMIISGPNTGGKTVALKTTGLLVAMAQAGLPVPATSARLPLFEAIYADIGDAQSIEQALSTFSAHVVNVERIARVADEHSLVLLDELGSATDPEEGAALAVAVAEHFLERHAWSLITTHLTSLKVYAAKHAGVLNAAVGFDEERMAPTYELRLGVPGRSSGLNIAARLGLDAAIVANARAQMTTQQVDIGRFLDELHAQLEAATTERERLATAERALAWERERLEREGRAEQQRRTRELERELKQMIESFEGQVREVVKAIDDKAVAQKVSRDAALRVAQAKREFSAKFQSAVEAATPQESRPAKQREPREAGVGDLVRLRSLNREGRVLRTIDAKMLEVQVGPMKMRVPRGDVAEIVAGPESLDGNKRRGGVNVATASSDSLTMEINVIGRTSDEAEGEVDRFVERAYLAGVPRIRVVHGVGMGILRRTLREFLKNHPYVTSIAEPPYNEGGQGATIVELRS